MNLPDAPEAAQLHASGKRYHINCGGEVRARVIRLHEDLTDETVACDKCGARWSKSRFGWLRVRAGQLTWDRVR